MSGVRGDLHDGAKFVGKTFADVIRDTEAQLKSAMPDMSPLQVESVEAMLAVMRAADAANTRMREVYAANQQHLTKCYSTYLQELHLVSETNNPGRAQVVAKQTVAKLARATAAIENHAKDIVFIVEGGGPCP